MHWSLWEDVAHDNQTIRYDYFLLVISMGDHHEAALTDSMLNVKN